MYCSMFDKLVLVKSLIVKMLSGEHKSRYIFSKVCISTLIVKGALPPLSPGSMRTMINLIKN